MFLKSHNLKQYFLGINAPQTVSRLSLIFRILKQLTLTLAGALVAFMNFFFFSEILTSLFQRCTPSCVLVQSDLEHCVKA